MRHDQSERGQSLVLIAIFFFFVFLAFAALGVDGTMIYLRRRELQNIADAAALAAAEQLSQGNGEAIAYQEARDSIAGNDGRVEWYSTSATPNPPDTNLGSGLDLIQGIQITDACDVRVALHWSDAGTYFAQFLGRDTLQVGARAHASCSKAGGLQPIAIKRFGDETDWNFSLTNANDASVYCDGCTTQFDLDTQGMGNATDFLRPQSIDEIEQWPGWPPEDPSLMYQSPSPHADLASGAPGREYCILGSCVSPNQGTTSYSGMVNLDIRHLSAPPVAYFNGIDPGSNTNTLKDLAEYYIRRGYCCDIPRPGDQVAMLSGTSASFGPQALQQTYVVSDMIAVIVYNGHVFDSPSLAMTGPHPNYRATYPTTSTITSNVLTYSIHLDGAVRPGNIYDSSTAGLTMRVEGLNGFATWGFVPTPSPVIGRNGINDRWLTLVVTPTTVTVGATTQVVTGTRMFYVSAIDDKVGGDGTRRYWAGIATVGDTVNGVQRKLPSVTCTPTNSDDNYPFVATIKGQQAKYSIELDLWEYPTDTPDQDVTVSFSGTLPAGFEWVNSPPWSKSTKANDHPGSKFGVNLKINDTAQVNVVHEIPLTVSAPGAAPQTCKLYVLVEEAGSTSKDYVEILGYAVVQITGYYNNENPVNPGQSANSVRGRIVSRLMRDPSELTYGLRARLIPWEP